MPVLQATEVEKRMKTSKKPISTVPGDIPAVLYNKYPNMLSVPVTHIFNLITATGKWPTKWKIEYVTVIPKKPDPQLPSECRNISCTNFLSKLYESFLLSWSREEVRPKINQYGGEKGASATQLLIEVVSDITEALKDNRAGMVLSAVDFSKAFNRLDHGKCLRAFARKGSSSQFLGLLASFLSGRFMTVRIGAQHSNLKPVNAGAPQGSVLGCYLFNIGVDDLDEDTAHEPPGQAEAHEETLVRTDDFPAVSTPIRVQSTAEITESPIPRSLEQEFTMLPRVANIPHWIRKPKDPTYNEGILKSYKFVDDGVNTSKVNMRKARMLVEDGSFFKEIIDLRTQNHIEKVKRRAEEKGMAINAQKTGLMLVSAATSFEARVRVNIGGETVTGSDSLKILGVTIDNDMTFKTHVQTIAARTRSKTWALSKLKKKGLSEERLLRAYKCLIRPTTEYAAPAWHSLITAGQMADLEKQQVQALKNIYGPSLSANKLRKKAQIELLSKRRENLVLNFAQKSLKNRRTSGWFKERTRPSYSRRDGVIYPKYREEIARTDRYRNSPKNYLIRKLNEKGV